MATAAATADTPASAAALRSRAVRGGAIILAARLVAQLFQWSVTLLVARLLLPDDYGMMAAGTLFVGLADMLAEAGVGRALVQKKELTDDDVAQGFTLSVLLAAVLYGLLCAIAGPAADYLQRPGFAPFLCVLALLLFLVPVRTVTSGLLERELHLGRMSLTLLAGAFLQSSLVLGLALAGLGYWALAAGVIAGRSLEAISLSWAASWRPRLARPGSAAAELLRFGMHLSAGSILWFAYSNADMAVVGSVLGPVALGYYFLALQLMSLPVQKLSTIVNQAAYPVYCRLQDDRPRLRDWYLRVTVMQNFVAMPALAGMALVAADGLPLLLGPRWQPAVLLFQLLCPVGMLMVVSAGLLPLLIAMGRPDINLRYTAACAVLFPGAFLGAALLGQRYGDVQAGLLAVCLAWLLLYPLVAAGLVHCTRHLSGLGLTQVLKGHMPILVAVEFMSCCVLEVQAALGTAPTAVRLIAAIAAGVASYSLWMLLIARHTILADLAAVWRELRGRRQESMS